MDIGLLYHYHSEVDRYGHEVHSCNQQHAIVEIIVIDHFSCQHGHKLYDSEQALW